jgi:TnpA family transposase
LLFYTHVSDRFARFHSKVIAANAGAAPHVIDGLLDHESGIMIREHATDTAGAVFFNRLGEPSNRTFQKERHRASGVNLIVSAIIRWNTVYFAPAVRHLRERGIDVPDTLIAHVVQLRRRVLVEKTRYYDQREFTGSFEPV